MHIVYTPVNSVASGGHLYNYESMHLVEMSRHFDRFYTIQATNAVHGGAFRTICRMVMAMPYLCTDKSEFKLTLHCSRLSISKRIFPEAIPGACAHDFRPERL